MQEKVTTSGTSVNENLLSGPDLTNQLIKVLEKFRVGPAAFMTNKQVMFSQVKVPEKQTILKILMAQ